MASTAGTTGTTPKRCAVIGGGRMGSGIAHALLVAGAQVVVVDRTDQLTAASERVTKAVQASVERGQLADSAPVLARLEVVSEIADVAEAELAIEAVFEDLELKSDTFRLLSDAVAPEAFIASNTSSISIDQLAEAVSHPHRFIGLHFFNPVPASKLVEVVVGKRTSEDLTTRAEGWVRDWGKTPVTVKSSPGFASSRLGVALGLEAIRMVEEDVASPENIDAAMMLGYGHPMGPLKLTDLVGLDVRLDISRYLADQLGPRFTPPGLLIDMVGQGDLGRKTGRGFYDWSEDR